MLYNYSEEAWGVQIWKFMEFCYVRGWVKGNRLVGDNLVITNTYLIKVYLDNRIRHAKWGNQIFRNLWSKTTSCNYDIETIHCVLLRDFVSINKVYVNVEIMPGNITHVSHIYPQRKRNSKLVTRARKSNKEEEQSPQEF